MVNIAVATRVMQKLDAAMDRLRVKADELVATPQTMADFGRLPHVLKILVAADEAWARRPILFPNTIQVKVTEARGIAIAMVQHLLVQALTKLAGIESIGIRDCASLLRRFDLLMTLIDPNCSVSEAFQALDRQIQDFKALVVDKATATLQVIVASASANHATTPWPVLLRDLGDFEVLLSIDPTIFFNAEAIWSLMDRTLTLFCPPPTRARATPVPPVHVNRVVWDLYNNPTAPHLATTASSAFGGVCSNIFRSAPATTYGRMWVNSPLPKTPSLRTIAATWITSHLHEQASLLRAQCQVDLRPQESASQQRRGDLLVGPMATTTRTTLGA